MPTFQEKTKSRQITKIENKFKTVREDAEGLILLLQKCLNIFERRVKEFIGSDEENFKSLYRNINNALEDFQEKLILAQSAIEQPTDVTDVFSPVSEETVAVDEEEIPKESLSIPSPAELSTVLSALDQIFVICKESNNTETSTTDSQNEHGSYSPLPCPPRPESCLSVSDLDEMWRQFERQLSEEMTIERSMQCGAEEEKHHEQSEDYAQAKVVTVEECDKEKNLDLDETDRSRHSSENREEKPPCRDGRDTDYTLANYQKHAAECMKEQQTQQPTPEAPTQTDSSHLLCSHSLRQDNLGNAAIPVSGNNTQRNSSWSSESGSEKDWDQKVDFNKMCDQSHETESEKREREFESQDSDKKRVRYSLKEKQNQSAHEKEDPTLTCKEIATKNTHSNGTSHKSPVSTKPEIRPLHPFAFDVPHKGVETKVKSILSSASSSSASHINCPSSFGTHRENCEAELKSVQSSSSSTSYFSVCDATDSSALTNDHAKHPVTSSQQNEIHKSFPSMELLSQASYSLSSNLSDLGLQCIPDSPDNVDKDLSQHFSVMPLDLALPMSTTAMLTDIKDPGNFWMQLECSRSSVPRFPKKKLLNSTVPSSVEKGDFCLAPSKSLPFYFRVKILSVGKTTEEVQVNFIDYGNSQVIPIRDLREMPIEAYDIPMQAINCFLAEVSAPNNIWRYAAIQKLKEFSNNYIETHIKTKKDDKYGVQLIATNSLGDEDFSCDIGQTLYEDGFAVKNEDLASVLNDSEHISISNQATCDSGDLASVLNDNEHDISISNQATCDSGDLETVLNGNEHDVSISNQTSCDSGVSVTFNQQPSSLDALNSLRLYDSPPPVEENLCNKKLESISQCDAINKFADLTSFDSVDNLHVENLAFVREQETFPAAYNKCLKTCTCKCPLHLLIPFPSITFVKENTMVVMLSHIVYPNEFYVNMAMETSLLLDELLEQMTIAYSSLPTSDASSIVLDDLKEGMFCAARFEDGNWYRVKVLSILLNFDETPNVYVQYVDYGNKTWIKNTDLKVLNPEFAEHPSFSVKCSLAGVFPTQSTDKNAGESQSWSEEAIKTFKEMVDFNKPLTAEICGTAVILNNDPLQVFLWDGNEDQDIFINETFASTGMAEFDVTKVQEIFKTKVKKTKEIEVLNHWNPMADEYRAIENSYGVDIDDFQVATSGYKPTDEEYICKYYALRGGFCPRGENCSYKHVPLAEGGVTRDQEEIYSFDSHPPLPVRESHVLVHVSAVVSPNHFYVQLPYGNKTIDEIDSCINKGVSRESILNQEVPALFDALNAHYSNKPFDERTTIALAYGNIVVARRQYDQTWHRGRIIDVQDVDKHAKVFYVDFGNEEWVERRNIREIVPEFLHTPFQAVECCLYDVEPLGFEKGRRWSSNAVSCFKNLVSDIMLAHVAFSFNGLLHVSLKLTTKDDHRTVKDHLIREGFGQEKTIVKQKKPESRYLPG